MSMHPDTSPDTSPDLASVLPPSRLLDDAERARIRAEVIGFFLEEYEREAGSIDDTTDLNQDIGMDSLSFLELFDELKINHGLDADIRATGRYALEHPVTTVGELLDQIYLLLEGRVDLRPYMEGAGG
jgi:acyl carrier protein